MIRVERLRDENDVDIDAVERLLTQLRGPANPMGNADWNQLLQQENVHVWLAWSHAVPATPVGALTLVVARIPTKPKAWIEDVVVDAAWRRKGVASILMNTAAEFATRAGCQIVELTSRPDRIEANSFYHSIGYERRNTNVYRLRLPRNEQT